MGNLEIQNIFNKCMFKEYKDYLKDNPQGFWFKRKLYGWGWKPVKWQGWLVVLIYVIAIAFLASDAKNYISGSQIPWKFILPLIGLTSILFVICYKTGEKPKW